MHALMVQLAASPLGALGTVALNIAPDQRVLGYLLFLALGATLAFGTDWDVAPLNPMLGLYAAVTRSTLDGKHPNGWTPEQKISIEEAIEAYTLGSAYAEFQEKDKGSITPGKLADFVLLSDNVLKIDPRAIRDAKVEMTMVDGKIVYGGPPQ